jgi:methionine-rich copper-binding protein CopC
MAAAPMTMATCSSGGQLPGSEPKRVFGRAKAATVLVLIVSASLWSDGCLADPMVLMESYPVVNQIMDGSATTFSLRFDGPVDHAGARLTLVTPMGSRTLHARLGSQPNTIFVAVGKLASGAYRLTWTVRAPDGNLSKGDIPFRVTPG